MAKDTRQEEILATLTMPQQEVFLRLKERFAADGTTLLLSDDGRQLIYLRADGSEITRGPIANLNA